MKAYIIVLLGLTLFVLADMRSKKAPPKWAQLLSRSQKIFAIVAILLTLLIVLNPEFLALGLLGDTAFFDMMVLALTLQMHTFVVRSLHICLNGLRRSIRWVGVPSPGLLYLIAISTIALRELGSAVQRITHRLLS